MNFNIERLVKQLKWDAFGHGRLLLIGFGVVFGLQAFMTFLAVIDGNFGRGSFHEANFGLLLMIGGLVFTSMIFSEMKEVQGRQFYLTIPSSHLEKFVSKLLITTVGFVVFTVISYWLFSFLNSFLAKILGGYDFRVFYVFTKENIGLIKTYLVVQSIFLLGAITFRRTNFLKTGLAIFAIGAILTTIWGIFFGFTFWDKVSEGSWNFVINGDEIFYDMERKGTFFLHLLYWLFWGALAPVMWLISYFKLTEKEV